MRVTTADIHVLHVDDDPDFLDLAATFLERADETLDVTTAATADEALDNDLVADVDCVVSDFDMPGQTGIEFLRAVRELHDDIPFILYTGKGSEEVASDAISAGVTDYLQKEAGSDQYDLLANRITNAVHHTRAQRLVQRAFDAMDNSREGIALLDEDGEFIYVNEAYAEIVGYDVDELMGEFWEIVYPEEQIQRIYEEILDAVPVEGHWTGDTVYQRKGGDRILVNHALTYSEEGTMICLLRDLADTEAQDRALREEREHFELFIEAVEGYAIFLLDPDGYIISWNQGAERLKGYSREEILGSHVSTFYTETQRAENLPEQLLERALADGSVEHVGPRRQKDGATFKADVVITAVYDGDGTHRGFVKVTRDVGESGV